MTDCSRIEIDGHRLEFVFSYNELVDAEEVSGCNLQEGLERLLSAGSMTAAQFRGLIFSMIAPYPGFPKEPAAQLKACGALVRIDTMQPIRGALMEACTIAVSEEYHQKYLDVVAKAQAEAKAAEDAEAQEMSEEDKEAAALREAASAVLG